MEKISNKLNWIIGVLLIIIFSIWYSIYFNYTSTSCKSTDKINQSNYIWNWWYHIENGKVFVYVPWDSVSSWLVPKYLDMDTKYFKALSSWYAKDDKYVYFWWNKIEWVDYCSFDVNIFKFKDDEQISFTKDKNNVYYIWKIFEVADANSFVIVSRYYYKDKYNVYTLHWKLMHNMDSHSLKYNEENDIAYDKNWVYIWENLSILWADGESFEKVRKWDKYRSDFYKDNNHVYNSEWYIIEWADVNSFTNKWTDLLSYDKNWVYYGTSIIKWADWESFKNIWHFYGKDNNNIYYIWISNRDWKTSYAKVVENADINSFVDISSLYYPSLYAKDKNHVFYEWKIIENADVYRCTTYETCKDNYPLWKNLDIWTKKYDDKKKITYDKNWVLLYNNIYFDWADWYSFERLWFEFYKDKNYVYNKKWEIVKWADTQTFYLKPNSIFYSDKNWVYSQWYRFYPWADINTFERLELYYSKDKYNVFFNSNDLKTTDTTLNIAKVIVGADVESFKWIKWNNLYAIDKNNVYYNWKIVKNANVNKCMNIEECVKNYPSYNLQ